MAHKVLTGEEKYALLNLLQDGINDIENESMKDLYSIMLALLYENILMERETAEANVVPVSNNVPNVKDIVRDVVAQFETTQLPSVITRQYVTEFTELADNLAMLSEAVTHLKELLVQAVSLTDAYKRPDDLTFQ